MTAGPKGLLPGLGLLAGIAITARFLDTAIPFLTPLVLAISIGAVVANTVGVPTIAERGASKHSLLLETAVVLLGARLSLEAMFTVGPLLVGLVLAVVAFGLLLVPALSRVAGLNDRLGTLLAAGSSICGISAIAAVAPACDAEETQIAHAAATILLFDAVTIVLFPALGRVLHLDSQLYGIWVGLSMFSTGPVAAAGFARSPAAGKWATMTKLARNALIGAVAVWYSFQYANRNVERDSVSLRRIWAEFPKFLVGFVSLAVVTNVGLLPEAVVDLVIRTSDALFLLAFAGLGLKIRFEEMRNAGAVPVGVVGAYLLTVSGLTYLLVLLVF